eukprot:CAMPEP_0180425782 /NCGR_PEP_ID=MMETSP1036_2-20121128/5449_1 /TAXON_ID=632150 /ORGANISM="Azadinium spinosum, Strain 3D9" /LENGTH=37 /DNA_ID= /DNA_START= /DNA_END= /DNA_ORIENTATION=
MVLHLKRHDECVDQDQYSDCDLEFAADEHLAKALQQW